jgi:hypothetical protein
MTVEGITTVNVLYNMAMTKKKEKNAITYVFVARHAKAF